MLAEDRAASAAGAASAAPFQAGSAASSPAQRRWLRSAHVAATCAPSEIPPTSTGSPASAAAASSGRAAACTKSSPGSGAGAISRIPASRNGASKAAATNTSSEPVPGSRIAVRTGELAGTSMRLIIVDIVVDAVRDHTGGRYADSRNGTDRHTATET